MNGKKVVCFQRIDGMLNGEIFIPEKLPKEQ